MKIQLFCQCNNGLRQGENLSPILFSLFVNDMEHYLSNNSSVGLNFPNNDLQSLLKTVVLLYADDMILFAESEDEMLNDFSKYCKDWKLNTNVDKTFFFNFWRQTSMPE